MKTTLASLPSPKVRPVQFTDAQAREVLEAYERSGLSATAFARQHSIGVHRLYAWKRRFRKPAAVPAFIPVRVATSEGKEQGQMTGTVEIHRAGFMIRVVGRVDTQQLRDVLAALEVAPC